MNNKMNYIQDWKSLAKKADWSVVKLAKSCEVSLRTLERQFPKVLGKTPKVWLAEQRHHFAIKLLHHGTTKKLVAATVGYKKPGNFSRAFSKFRGKCPIAKRRTNWGKLHPNASLEFKPAGISKKRREDAKFIESQNDTKCRIMGNDIIGRSHADPAILLAKY